MFISISDSSQNPLALVLIIFGIYIYQRQTDCLFPFEKNIQRKYATINHKLVFTFANTILFILIIYKSFWT
jgi:hypothetical protein